MFRSGAALSAGEEELMSIILQTGLQQFTPTTLVDMPTWLEDLNKRGTGLYRR